mmetsp:Transcript_15782/g.37754  ORF Transcript_15782/g.37754 Transcript_15782/m.37754 type:complete len:292 (+) Transcript_15782:546-1421(+)
MPKQSPRRFPSLRGRDCTSRLGLGGPVFRKLESGGNSPLSSRYRRKVPGPPWVWQSRTPSSETFGLRTRPSRSGSSPGMAARPPSRLQLCTRRERISSRSTSRRPRPSAMPTTPRLTFSAPRPSTGPASPRAMMQRPAPRPGSPSPVSTRRSPAFPPLKLRAWPRPSRPSLTRSSRMAPRGIPATRSSLNTRRRTGRPASRASRSSPARAIRPFWSNTGSAPGFCATGLSTRVSGILPRDVMGASRSSLLETSHPFVSTLWRNWASSGIPRKRIGASFLMSSKSSRRLLLI